MNIPSFTLKASDILSIPLVEKWIEEYSKLEKVDKLVLKSAKKRLKSMKEWRKNHEPKVVDVKDTCSSCKYFSINAEETKYFTSAHARFGFCLLHKTPVAQQSFCQKHTFKE